MKTKFSFKQHVFNKAFVYVVLAIVVPLASYYAIEIKTNPKDHEKFTLFIASSLKEGKDLKGELTSLFPEDLLIRVESHTTNESMFNTYVNTYGEISDIHIMPQSYLDNTTYFPYHSFAKESEYYSDTNYLKYEKHYGILANDTKLKDYINFEENYFIFINNKSVHTLNLFDDGETDQINRFLTAYVK